jgi:STE24 endopeptidase
MSDNINKNYSQRKLIISIVNGLIAFLLFISFIVTGMSHDFARFIEISISNIYLQFLVFTFALSVAGMLISLPLDFYSGYILEHRYGLSNQALSAWIWEELKGTAIGLLIGMPLLVIFYFCVLTFVSYWWIPVGAVYFIFSVLMVRLAPTLLFPIFYQFKPLESESLKKRLTEICKNISIQIAGIYQFNLSKNTKKANAAFAGIGKSKRILLADTLLNNFSEDETEMIFAHEAGHYYHGHINKLLFIGAGMIFTGLGITAYTYEWLVANVYQQSITDLSALPILALLLIIFSMIVMPLQNMISRYFEGQADRYALTQTRKPVVFIDAMKKLAVLNLSDDSPHPVVEFLFYSHPSIKKRILMAEYFQNQENP